MLHRAVNDHASEFLGINQLEIHGHVSDLHQQILHTFFAEQSAENDQDGGVIKLAVFAVHTTAKELPT